MKSIKFDKETRIVETYKANCYKTQINEDSIILEFGHNISKEEVTIVSSVSLSPKMLEKYIMRLIRAGFEYEEKYKAEIGFGNNKNVKGEE